MPLRLDFPGETPPSLYRRSSLLKRARSGRSKTLALIPRGQSQAPSAPSSLSIVCSPTKVPNELLDRIVQLYVQGIVAETGPKWSQKIVFKRFIKDLTLVSKDFRYLALRYFFSDLFFESKDDSRDLLNYLEIIDTFYREQGLTCFGYSWIRSLSAPSFLISANDPSLGKLTNLRDLYIDFMHSNVLLQRSCSEHLFSTLASHPVVHNLTSLVLSALPRIDVYLFKLIAEAVPGLVSLHISSTDALDLDCCSECYEESFTRIVHSPIPTQYPNVQALTNAFGPSLAPLKCLTHLYIGIFLSRQVLLDLHARHNQDICSESPPVDSTFETIHECFLCEKEARMTTKQDELLGSLVLAYHIKSLRFVGWSSCFGMRHANGSLGKDVENFLEGEPVQPNILKLSSKLPRDLPKSTLDRHSKFASFAMTTLVVNRTGKKIGVTRVL